MCLTAINSGISRLASRLIRFAFVALQHVVSLQCYMLKFILFLFLIMNDVTVSSIVYSITAQHLVYTLLRHGTEIVGRQYSQLNKIQILNKILSSDLLLISQNEKVINRPFENFDKTKIKMSSHAVINVRAGMVSIKHGTILHGVDSARPIAHEPIVHENNRASYRLDTLPIQHRLDCVRISYSKTIGHPLDCARIGYAKTIRHRLDCARNGYTRTIQHRLDCARIGSAKNDSSPALLCTNRLFKNDSAQVRLCTNRLCKNDSAPVRLCTVANVHQ